MKVKRQETTRSARHEAGKALSTQIRSLDISSKTMRDCASVFTSKIRKLIIFTSYPPLKGSA